MKKNLAIFSMIAVLFLVSCGKGYQYKQISQGVNQKSIEQELGKEPDSTKEEAGMTYLQYDACPYMDYKGTTTYCLTDDALNYSKWEYLAENSQDAQDAYQAIKTDFEMQYGEGEETKDEGTFWVCAWYLGTESTVSLTCTSESQEFQVSILSTIKDEQNE